MTISITSTGSYLPGPAIDNNAIESHLGLIHGKSSRLKNRILKSNGIKTRHYALDANQQTAVSNEEMATRAAEECIRKSGIRPDRIKLLCCATTQGDLVMPGFASMLQASLGLKDLEIYSSHGICSCSMMALKTAFNSLRLREHECALVVASELASRQLKASRYEAIQDQQAIDFNAEFLRWMLSDGAGALLLESAPLPRSFHIEWIKGYSHADAFPVCMSTGTPLDEEDSRSWQDFDTYKEAEAAGALLIRQDVRLLENIVKVGVDGFLRLISENLVDPGEIDHVLCHYSSLYFKSRIFDMLGRAGVAIPEEKWYSNLTTRGNTGCASLFIMLDEFKQACQPNPGDKVFCMVPESGRFNTTYMLLTVT